MLETKAGPSAIIPVIYGIYRLIRRLYQLWCRLRKYQQPCEHPIQPYVTLIWLVKSYVKHRLKLK